MEPHELSPVARPTPTRRALLSAGTATAVAAATAPLIPFPPHPTDDTEDGAHGASGPGGPYRPQPPDRQLRALLRQIDPRRIEAIINQLVAFGTRHTLSSQTDPVRGIGAATEWVFGQMQQFFLEQSNVNMVSEMTDLITAQRAYEINSKVIQASDSMMGTITQIR